MDFAWDAGAEAVRKEVRGFLDEHLAPELEERIYVTGVSHDDGFARALGERNWIAPEWPREGCDALDAFSVHVVNEELTR
ncbi:MAG TPA: acyl-CoA dehydrogenase family protein, partial [Acidimicrobiales bacterium]|nr:acyl-CoA dehydrogenase family protein [Acidimicrobiales bacterium]